MARHFFLKIPLPTTKAVFALACVYVFFRVHASCEREQTALTTVVDNSSASEPSILMGEDTCCRRWLHNLDT